LWPASLKDETFFCCRVALTNKLELLRWAREKKKYEWDSITARIAALKGNLEMLKYCVVNQCPINEWVVAGAAGNGHLECLRYLHEEVKAPWDGDSAAYAAEGGHLHILEYLVERKYDKHDAEACVQAAGSGHIDCLKFLRETAKAPWNFHVAERAYRRRKDAYNRTECLRYVLDNNCPLPSGWRYEDGTLHTKYETERLY
jgi:hypothetical protein